MFEPAKDWRDRNVPKPVPLLARLNPPPDPAVVGWRRISGVQEGHWDGGQWTAARYLPGVQQPPEQWIGYALVAVFILAPAVFISPMAAILPGLYMLPAIYACLRSADWWKFNAGAVSLVGILTGWTVIGWVAALIMAVMKDRPPT